MSKSLYAVVTFYCIVLLNLSKLSFQSFRDFTSRTSREHSRSDYATDGSAEGHAATQHIDDERGTPRTFREHSRFSHPGGCHVVRFAHTSAGLRIVVSSCDTNQLSIVDEKGRVSITKETDTVISDMCVSDDQVYATAPIERNIQVYRLSDLSLVRKITTVNTPYCITHTDHDIVIYVTDNTTSRVGRITETGEVTHTSSCEFSCNISGILEISRGGNIFVSDYFAHTIVILSPDLSHITNITGPHIVYPCGLCLVCESVFVACEGSNSVIELDAHGIYKRTVLGLDDGLDQPYQIAYDIQTRKLVVSSSAASGLIVVFVGEP